MRLRLVGPIMLAIGGSFCWDGCSERCSIGTISSGLPVRSVVGVFIRIHVAIRIHPRSVPVVCRSGGDALVSKLKRTSKCRVRIRRANSDEILGK